MICLFIYSCFSVKASEEAGQAEIMRSVAGCESCEPCPLAVHAYALANCGLEGVGSRSFYDIGLYF